MIDAVTSGRLDGTRLALRGLLEYARGRSIFTHLTRRERLLLFRLARRLASGSTIVEIGSYLGASTTALAAGLHEADGSVYAVDTWTNLGMSEGPRDTYDGFLRNTASFGKRIVPLRGMSTTIAETFDRVVDLLFIDGDHSYEGVVGDLRAWLPKVRDQGFVVLHDYNWADGVRRAVREFVKPLQASEGQRLDSLYWATITTSSRGHAMPKDELSKTEESTPRATVIVPTYNRPEPLRETLTSLQSQEISGDRFEILVVNNGEREPASKVVSDLNAGGRTIRCVYETRVGLHHARHTGAREARGDILAYVDDDVVAPAGWLASLLRPFEDPRVAVVGGAVRPRGHGTWPRWWSRSYEGYLSLLDLGDERLELGVPRGVYGLNMAVRRTALYEVGGFNPDGMGDRSLIWLRGDGETGFQNKIRDAGHAVVYEPSAWLFHQIPAARLTPQYLYWRSFIQGISDSYTRARNGEAYPRLLVHSVTCLTLMMRRQILAMFRPDERVSSLAGARYWYGRGAHQFMMAVSPRLRRHVRQERYL